MQLFDTRSACNNGRATLFFPPDVDGAGAAVGVEGILSVPSVPARPVIAGAVEHAEVPETGSLGTHGTIRRLLVCELEVTLVFSLWHSAHLVWDLGEQV